VTTHFEITPDFVRSWCSRYEQDELGDRERKLFSQVHPRIARDRYLRQRDFLEIGRWKSSRTLGKLRENGEGWIREVTLAAFDPHTDERALTLTSLAGVGIQMASAFLTVWNPDEYTVIDRRAVDTLRRAGRLTTERWPGYGFYLRVCRDIVEGLDIEVQPESVSPLRTLDRALWMYGKTLSRG
jgi:hypothetical protein